MSRTHHRNRPLLFKSHFDDEREDALNALPSATGRSP